MHVPAARDRPLAPVDHEGRAEEAFTLGFLQRYAGQSREPVFE